MAGSSLDLPVNPLVRGYASFYSLSTRGSTVKRTHERGDLDNPARGRDDEENMI
jgi:hypothetical protein